jgi:hypothetical protein
MTLESLIAEEARLVGKLAALGKDSPSRARVEGHLAEVRAELAKLKPTTPAPPPVKK